MDKIQPDQIRTDMNPMVLTSNVRFVQGGSALDKPSFGTIFMAGLKKFGSIFGKIGASIMSFFPFPGSQAAAAGLYGLSNLADASYKKDLQKRSDNLALDEAANQASFTTLTPGFGMFGSPEGGVQGSASGPLGTERLDTVLSREAAARSEISMM